MTAIARIARAIALLAGAMVLAITLLVSYDVGMRYLFDAPQLFVDELAGFLQVFVIFAGLAYAFVSGGHVRVDIVTARLRGPVRARLRVFTLLAGIVVLLIASWVTGSSAITAHAYGRVSTVELYPLWVPMIAIPSGLLLMALAMGAAAWRQWRTLRAVRDAADEITLREDGQ